MARPSLQARCAGLAIPLFSLRGRRDAGIGEILDLVPLLQWAAGFGQRVVQLLPINETGPGEASPYNALSAFAIDPLYLSVHAIAGAPPVGAVGPRDGVLPRDAIRAAKLGALAAAFVAFRRTRSSPEWRRFRRFSAAQRHWLDDYVLYRALRERQGAESWEHWPAELRQRQPAALTAAAAALQPRLEFLRFVQWRAAEQWGAVRRAARQCGVWLKGDLPFVISRDSADVWARQDEFDPDYSVGAPPDDFSASGQSWGLPMYRWPRVRATDFAWWRLRVRQASALYDLFRIDHIIGFFRTYAIANDGRRRGFVPADESAQREQGEAFLRAVLEDSSAALPVAEDLGSVPAWVRAVLHQLGIPGYKVFRWERDPHQYRDPRQYDPLSVATTGTHDTDTLVEWWAGLAADERAQVLALLGSEPEREAAAAMPLPHAALLERLYQAGSAFVIVPLQDLLGWRDRINVPATPSHQNWNWRLPLAVEELAGDAAVNAATATVAGLLKAAGRSWQ
ncbi:MAG: 4-alpha-glucanotransferase [Deltaproteobacteria bacterium]|nr:4-alpha-glucanotransferase [Deltaproteobacteria bacterium]